jgi:hypothetical protein
MGQDAPERLLDGVAITLAKLTDQLEADADDRDALAPLSRPIHCAIAICYVSPIEEEARDHLAAEARADAAERRRRDAAYDDWAATMPDHSSA